MYKSNVHRFLIGIAEFKYAKSGYKIADSYKMAGISGRTCLISGKTLHSRWLAEIVSS